METRSGPESLSNPWATDLVSATRDRNRNRSSEKPDAGPGIDAHHHGMLPFWKAFEIRRGMAIARLGCDPCEANGAHGSTAVFDYLVDENGSTPHVLQRLDELRRRLLVSLASLLGATILCLFYSGALFGWLLTLVRVSLPDETVLVATRLPEVFLLQIKTAALAALFLTAPVWSRQAFLFAGAAAKRPSARFVALCAVLGLFLVVLGVGFAHFVVVPHASRFLITFGSGKVRPLLSVSNAVSFYVQFVLAMSAVFQLPTVVLVLSRMGVVTTAFLVHHARHAIVLVFAIAAVITPTPDLVTQSLLAIPMTFLYAVSILLSWLVRPTVELETGVRERRARFGEGARSDPRSRLWPPAGGGRDSAATTRRPPRSL